MAYSFEDKLKEIIVSCGDNIDITKINENIDFVRDYYFNSVTIIRLVVELENAFDIEVDDENLLQEKLSSYKSLVEILKDKLGEDQL